MPKLLGIIGALIVCAGLDLLWQSRVELRFWASIFRQALRALLRGPLRLISFGEAARKRQTAIQLLLGLGLALVLGPMLIAAGITLMLHVHL